jgi:hypothetical protein
MIIIYVTGSDSVSTVINTKLIILLFMMIVRLGLGLVQLLVILYDITVWCIMGIIGWVILLLHMGLGSTLG